MPGHQSVLIPGCSSFGNCPINIYFKLEYIGKMTKLFFCCCCFLFLGHVGNCRSCEDGPLGICAQSAASPLPFSGTGIFVLFCMEATFTPVGGLQ